jgi:hypothetical protein
MQARNTALRVHLVLSSCEMQEPEMKISTMGKNLKTSHQNLFPIHHSQLFTHSTLQMGKLLNKGKMNGNVIHQSLFPVFTSTLLQTFQFFTSGEFMS